MTSGARTLVILSHGKESGPKGRKIAQLAAVAQSMGCDTLCPDYSDLQNPDARVARLMALPWGGYKNLVLVGSSMGGYVSAVAAETMKPAGLFLMAPAIGKEGYAVQAPRPRAKHMAMVLGLHDDVIDNDKAMAFARLYNAELHMLNDGHRLAESMDALVRIWEGFLRRRLP